MAENMYKIEISFLTGGIFNLFPNQVASKNRRCHCLHSNFSNFHILHRTMKGLKDKKKWLQHTADARKKRGEDYYMKTIETKGWFFTQRLLDLTSNSITTLRKFLLFSDE